MNMTFLFGCNGNDWEEDVEVTEEEYARLEKAYKEGKDFYRCDAVKDIYDRVWDIANQSATASLLEFDEDIAEKYKNDSSFMASDLYQINVQYYMDDTLDDNLEDE